MNTTLLIWLPVYTAAAMYVGYTFALWRMMVRADKVAPRPRKRGEYPDCPMCGFPASYQLDVGEFACEACKFYFTTIEPIP